MTDEEILQVVKFNLGLRSEARDEYLKMIISSAIAESGNAGIDPGGQDRNYQSEYYQYIADYSAWLYRTRGGTDGDEPRFLRLRRNNLIIGRQDV